MLQLKKPVMQQLVIIKADNDGGAFYIIYMSDVTFKGNSTVEFGNNEANKNGGALYLIQKSSILLFTCVVFHHNIA